MKIEFTDKNLERCSWDEDFAMRFMGKKRANLYKLRIQALRLAANFNDLRNLAGNFHELVGNRKGEWACNLDQPYRLIIKGSEPDTIIVWSEISEAEVKEIIDYHK